MEDYNESSRHAAAREVLEKTGLEVILEDFQYLFNDPEYDCDVYKLKVHPRIVLNQPSKGNGNISYRTHMKKWFEIEGPPQLISLITTK